MKLFLWNQKLDANAKMPQSGVCKKVCQQEVVFVFKCGGGQTLSSLLLSSTWFLNCSSFFRLPSILRHNHLRSHIHFSAHLIHDATTPTDGVEFCQKINAHRTEFKGHVAIALVLINMAFVTHKLLENLMKDNTSFEINLLMFKIKHFDSCSSL